MTMGMGDYIRTKVDGRWRLVDMDLFLDVHQQLADHFRARGLNGEALDVAIVEMLPIRLAQALDDMPVH